MDWFKKRLGIILWLAILLVILVVPRWRQQTRIGWQGGILSGNHWDFMPSSPNLSRPRIEAMAARAPDDFEVQLERVSGQFSYATSANPSRHRFLADYATLSRRFPRENAIRKAWLLDLTRGGLAIESASTYGDLAPQNRPALQPRWVSQAELEAAILAARQGARIEPRNAFFPWLESAFEFALQRPDAAMQALERAANAAYYDDGTLQTVRRRVEILGRGQSLDWGDKLNLMASVLLPHLGKIRATARAAMEVSHQAQKRGEPRRALQIASTVARAGSKISDFKGNIITVMVGDAIQDLAWAGALKNAGREVKMPIFPATDSFYSSPERLAPLQKYRLDLARALAIYARELKQESIAEQALTTLPSLRGERLGMAYRDPALESGYRGATRLMEARFLEEFLEVLSLAGAGAWLLSLLWTRGAVPASQRAMTMWAAFCTGASVVMFGVAVRYLGHTSSGFFGFPRDEDSPVWIDTYQMNLPFFLAFLWVFPPLFTSLLRRVKKPKWKWKKSGINALGILKMALYATIMGSGTALWLFGGWGPHPADEEMWPIYLLILALSLLAAGFFHAATTSGNLRIAALLFWSVPWIGAGALALSNPIVSPIWPTYLVIIALVFLALSVRLALGVHGTNWRWKPDPRGWWADWMGRTRILAATLAVAGAIGFLGAKIATLPAEARLTATINAQLQAGEVAWLEGELQRGHPL